MTRDEWERMPWPARERYVRSLNKQRHEVEALLAEVRAERERIARLKQKVKGACVPAEPRQTEEQMAPWLTRRRANQLAKQIAKDTEEVIQQRIKEWII